jgi:uncharacterized protein YndB with AHSA1/START domain
MTTSSRELKVTLVSDTQILWERGFDASRHLVFEAMTRPEHITQWMSGYGYKATCEVDLRVGGAYRYVFRNDEGNQFVISGEFREVSPPGRLVFTETMDDAADGAVNTMVLAERDGRTFMTLTTDFTTKEARDAAIATGMTEGAGEAYDRLNELARTLS